MNKPKEEIAGIDENKFTANDTAVVADVKNVAPPACEVVKMIRSTVEPPFILRD